MKEKKQEVNWKKEALFFGLFIYPINTFIIPYFDGEEISLKKSLIALPIYALAAIGYALSMKWWRKRNKPN